MKNIFKSRVFTFILGALIFSGITGVSAYNMFAKDIKYTPSDPTWKKSNGDNITNVEEALDELYINSSETKNIGTPFYTITSSGVTYTAPRDCVLYIYAYWNSSKYAAYVYVNGEEVTYFNEQTNSIRYIGDANGKNSHIMHIKKGDIISTRTGVSGLTYLLEFYDYE